VKTSRWIFFLVLFFLATMALSACAPTASTQQEVSDSTEIARTIEVEKTKLPASSPAPASVEKPVEQPVQPPVIALPTATPLSEASGAANEPVVQPTQIRILPTQTQPAAPFPEAPISPTSPGTATSTLEPGIIPVSPISQSEDHIVQVEWPVKIRLGESDVVQLKLISSMQGYVIITEYPEHQVVTQTVTVLRSPGFELFAVARLDGVGFELSPAGEQSQYILEERDYIWQWSLTPRQSGDHRLSVNLIFRWIPVNRTELPVREVVAYSRALDVKVISFMGLSRSQAMATGWFTLLLGSGLSFLAITIRPRRDQLFPAMELHSPNQELSVELTKGLHLSRDERSLLQSLFSRYARLIIEQEFQSGYSGARTFLILPVRSDGRNDAYTIAKIGERQAILKEYQNYETFVKDTLPPMTARIQRPPVSTKAVQGLRLAGIQYTFIGEPGRPPVSVHKHLSEKPDAGFVNKLLNTFGPNWWLQRKPYTFRIAAEYDRVLPTHLVIEPEEGKGVELDGHLQPDEINLRLGQLVTLRNFAISEKRLDGKSQSLTGYSDKGRSPLRVRWLSPNQYEGASGRIIANRQSLLESFVQGYPLYGLADPLDRVTHILTKTIIGSQSILHGDLNLENILVGPGDMLWLIDFAQTREGHTLFDFSHLGAEIIAHLASELIDEPKEFLSVLQHAPKYKHHPLNIMLENLEMNSSRLIFNPREIWEYRLTLALSCLGALKFFNLSSKSKHFLYLAAANILQDYQD
jgi:hypothetical protein